MRYLCSVTLKLKPLQCFPIHQWRIQCEIYVFSYIETENNAMFFHLSMRRYSARDMCSVILKHKPLQCVSIDQWSRDKKSRGEITPPARSLFVPQAQRCD